MNHVPSFLSEVTLDTSEQALYYNMASNWLKLHRQLLSQDEDGLLKLLLCELQTRRRPFIIGRLKLKYNRLRNSREDQEIMGTGDA